MRVKISADGATYRQLRTLAAALAEEGVGPMAVKLDGPELFNIETEMMGVNVWARVCTKLIRRNGYSIIDLINSDPRSQPNHVFYADQHAFTRTPETNTEPTRIVITPLPESGRHLR